ncbi:class I SAM-dependent methyltransferase [Dolosicoccus paucivorans]|uniref:Class I SAM-dependent methyltransferase n=1 Tax=Dolosicoccus paucivorans TaxID=84521 RepID=A0A1G8NF08_9LACT|nr:methyltransferase [Dolosicoccus paucivorans]PMC57842.1 class I SAM-dependent methyltransferase [Dolosicoccus paucivorans]SDI78834.1 16S rRNA (guanine1207-N2)-methyltransferase [Dolosicoccus paucivorans]
MGEHYYTKQPSVSHEEKEISAKIGNITLKLTTDRGVFSKDKLDEGSKILAETFIDQVKEDDFKLIELGSGYGPIALGIAKAYPNSHVTGVELNERAFDLSLRNAKQNNISNVTFICDDATNFELSTAVQHVVTNPPIRAGKKVVHAFVDQAYQLLEEKGALWVVIQKKQGAPSMRKHMEQIFGNVERVNLQSGYWILKSIK